MTEAGGPTGRGAAQDKPWMIAEVVFGVPFLLGVFIQLSLPGLLPRDLVRPWGFPAGVVLLAAGVAVARSARREFRAARQPTEPGQPTTRIVTTGVFSFSRNPLYLAATIFFTGLALTLALPWALLSVVPGMIACRYLLIAPEERYLAATLPGEYARYSAAVRRWIGRSRKARRDGD